MENRTNQLKIIFITPNVPQPNTGGGLRSYSILESLSGTGNLSLFVMTGMTRSEENFLNEKFELHKTREAETRKTIFSNVPLFFKYLFPFLFEPMELSFRINNLALQKKFLFPLSRTILFSWLSFWQSGSAHSNQVYRLQKSLQNLGFSLKDYLSKADMIVFDYSFMLEVFKNEMNGFKGIKILNTHNVEFLTGENYINEILDPIVKNWNKKENKLLKVDECNSVRAADVVFSCSELDKNVFEALVPGKKIVVIPNAIDESYYQPLENTQKEYDLLFTATFSYQPNKEGIYWFMKHVFPEVLKIKPATKILIAGKNADTLEMASNENVEIQSDLTDIRPCFNQSKIYVVPLLRGGGSRLKILEAAAMKLPIISTTKGAEGLEGLNASNMIFADSPEFFSAKIIELMEHPELQTVYATQLNEWYQSAFTLEIIKKKIHSVI